LALEAAAQNDEDRIRAENVSVEEDDTQIQAVLDELVSGVETDVERVVVLIAEGQRNKVMSSSMRWYWGTGGLLKAHGILRGTAKNRAGWRYGSGNELLTVLVQLASAHAATRTDDGSGPKPIRLQAFLEFLEDRFGILVDRPPDEFVGSDYAAAARDNLQAMLRRLRQMGIFRDLSDDFTVQVLHAPFADERVQVGV